MEQAMRSHPYKLQISIFAVTFCLCRGLLEQLLHKTLAGRIPGNKEPSRRTRLRG